MKSIRFTPFTLTLNLTTTSRVVTVTEIGGHRDRVVVHRRVRGGERAIVAATARLERREHRGLTRGAGRPCRAGGAGRARGAGRAGGARGAGRARGASRALRSGRARTAHQGQGGGKGRQEGEPRSSHLTLRVLRMREPMRVQHVGGARGVAPVSGSSMLRRCQVPGPTGGIPVRSPRREPCNANAPAGFTPIGRRARETPEGWALPVPRAHARRRPEGAPDVRALHALSVPPWTPPVHLG